MFIVNLLIQLVILVIAMVIAGLIMRWIISHPAECKTAIKKTKKIVMTPYVYFKALRAYLNWQRVGMGFSYSQCVSQEWDKYQKERTSEQPYYRQ